MQNTPTSQDLLNAVNDGEATWPHNAHAVEDQATELAVLAALGKPSDAPMGVGLYRRAGRHSSPVRRLFDVVFGRETNTWSDQDLLVAPCDRCMCDRQPRHDLWVATGASVVSVHCCQTCRDELDRSLSNLVWH